MLNLIGMSVLCWLASTNTSPGNAAAEASSRCQEEAPLHDFTFHNYALRVEIGLKARDLCFSVRTVSSVGLPGFEGQATPRLLEVVVGTQTSWFDLTTGETPRIPVSFVATQRRLEYRVHGQRPGSAELTPLFGQSWIYRN